MSYQYKLYKYQKKNKALLGGHGDELTPQKQHLIDIFVGLYDEIQKNPQIINMNIAVALYRLVNKHIWLHIPSVEDVGYNIFTEPNHFNVTNFWHDMTQPHGGIFTKMDCAGCADTSKLDQRISETNSYVSHHVDQHLFRISREYLYTYNLVTCSTLILIQDGYVGMMHIDAGNTYYDIMEFLEAYKKNIGEFGRTLQIHGFLNHEIFDEINKFTLLPVYDLIINQYKEYGHSIFSNILMNLPTHVTDEPYISSALYIFAIPNGNNHCSSTDFNHSETNTSKSISCQNGQIKGFYIDSRANVEQYNLEPRLIKIYEQQLAKPNIIVDRLKQKLNKALLIDLIQYIGTRHEITDENLYELLEYTISPAIDMMYAILKLKQFLIYHELDPNHFLLEKIIE